MERRRKNIRIALSIWNWPHYLLWTLKPAIHLSSNWWKCEKMLAKWGKREVYRWHFVDHLANHFFHLAFCRSRQAIGIFTKRQRWRTASFSSSFLQNQRWTKSAILWEVYSDWFAISRNSARTCRNARNDKYIASLTNKHTILHNNTYNKIIRNLE